MTSKARNRPLPPLQDRISFLMHRINAQMLRICNPRFERWGVDLVTSRMLVALLERGPMSSGEIVRTMALPQSTISHQVKRLESLGYVKRSVDPDDSRIIVAALSDAGEAVAIAANELSRNVTDAMIDAIGDRHVETLRAALKRMDQALEGFSLDEPPIRLKSGAVTSTPRKAPASSPPAPVAGDRPPSRAGRT